MNYITGVVNDIGIEKKLIRIVFCLRQVIIKIII